MAAKRISQPKIVPAGSVGPDSPDGRPMRVRGGRRATGPGDGGADEVYRSLVDNLAQMVFRKDLAGRYLFASRRYCAWLDRPCEEILGRSDADLFPAALANRLAADDRVTLAAGLDGEQTADYEFPGRSGRPRRLTRLLIRNARGAVIGLHGILDHQPDEELHRLQEEACLLSALLGSIPDSVYFKDARSRFRRISQSTATRFGVAAPAHALGKTDFDFFSAEHAEQALRDEQEVMRTGRSLVNVEEKETFTDGRVKWVSTTKMPLRDGAGRVVGTFGISRDVTEQKQMQAELDRHAMYDGLTSLPNRALYLNRLEHLLRRAGRAGERPVLFAVLYIDIDRFKGVNDTFGHQAGDELLVAVARRFETCLRPSDTLARLGGDDFAILLEELRTEADATRVAERIHQQLVVPLPIEGTEVFCSASIGIALSTSRYERPENMLRDAHIAMYRAKANGRARHELFDPDMHRRAVSQLKTETELRHAIERRELVVYYQPIVDLQRRVLTGFEALVRWRHPQRGLVPPGDFIPIAEETGLIAPIGMYVLHEACRQMREWQQLFSAHGPLRIAVNLSGHQLVQAEIVGQIREVLAATGLGPQALALEVTESALVRDFSAGRAVMEELRGLGIRLNLDDFGTGYSSLSYLQNLPVDTLKIDRSFVSRMRPDGGKAEIVHAIITLAQSMGMRVIAEGVETAEQLATLTTLGCDGAQGFFFARPLPPREIERLLRAGLPRF